jgi:hypothetical protein
MRWSRTGELAAQSHGTFTGQPPFKRIAFTLSGRRVTLVVAGQLGPPWVHSRQSVGKAKAMRWAQLSLMKTDAYKHPY